MSICRCVDPMASSMRHQPTGKSPASFSRIQVFPPKGIHFPSLTTPFNNEKPDVWMAWWLRHVKTLPFEPTQVMAHALPIFGWICSLQSLARKSCKTDVATFPTADSLYTGLGLTDEYEYCPLHNGWERERSIRH